MTVRGRAVETLPKLIRSLRRDSPSSTQSQPLPSLRRAFSLYDQINLIDNVPEDQLRFQGYTDTGFAVNGVNYEGSLLCVGNLLTSWGPNKFSEITPESLSIFQIIRPIPEILILGCGRHIEPVDTELRHFIRSTGMKLEALDSPMVKLEAPRQTNFDHNLRAQYVVLLLQRNAASTYNILNEEGRIVAAALLPYGVSS